LAFRANAFGLPLWLPCGIPVWNNIFASADSDDRERRKHHSTDIFAFSFALPLTVNLRRSMDRFSRKKEQGTKYEAEENPMRNFGEENTGKDAALSRRPF